MPSPTFGLAPHAYQRLVQVLAAQPWLEGALIYGSRAMGTEQVGSDIDLTLIAPKATLSDKFQLELALDDLNLPERIDLSLYHQLSHTGLREHIQRVGNVFWQRQQRPVPDLLALAS